MENTRSPRIPSEEWPDERLERASLKPLGPMTRLTFFARTSKRYFEEWLRAHARGFVDLEDGCQLLLSMGDWEDAGIGIPGLVVMGHVGLSGVSRRVPRRPTASRSQLVMHFVVAPCSSSRVEVTIRSATDPRVQPMIRWLLLQVTRAWPATTEVLAPFINAGPIRRPKDTTDENLPAEDAPLDPTPVEPPAKPVRVPAKQFYRHRWELVWKTIQPWLAKGDDPLIISEKLKRQNENLAYSPEIISDIISAGREGRLGR